MAGEAVPESTNFEKFQTGNPVVRRLIEGFYEKVEAEISPLAPTAVLDAGCGEGETLARLSTLQGADLTAIDTSEDAVAYTAKRLPGVKASVESLYALPFPDDSFDLSMCLEVLEHLEEPGKGLSELHRVTRGDVVISVPHEPWFRLGSAMRGKYLKTLGNHPEHVNHWNAKSLQKFLETRFSSVQVTRSFPWLIAHCRR